MSLPLSQGCAAGDRTLPLETNELKKTEISYVSANLLLNKEVHHEGR